MRANSQCCNYSSLKCSFKSKECGKEGKKLQKLEYLENEKSFSNEIKNIFHDFLFIKNKKVVDTSFKLFASEFTNENDKA